MRIDRFINKVLSIFGTYNKGGDRRAHFHSQNLNEDRHGNTSVPYHGRWWLHWNGRTKCALEWHLWAFKFGISAQQDYESEHATMLHVAFPPFSFFLTLPFQVPFSSGKSNSNYFNISIHNWALWWQFGGNTMEWDSRTPRWKRGAFHFDDFFLGKSKYSKRDIETRDMEIEMPEGKYPAKGTLIEATWKRPRWFAFKRIYVDVDVPGGIPYQGKGENDYDCGEDGLCGYSSDGASFHVAAQTGTEKVFEYRRKRDGNMMAKYPDPALRAIKKSDNSELNDLLVKAGKGPVQAT